MIPYVIVYRLLTKSDKQATQKRLELSTSAVTGRRSNQLSHWAKYLIVSSLPLTTSKQFS